MNDASSYHKQVREGKQGWKLGDKVSSSGEGESDEFLASSKPSFNFYNHGAARTIVKDPSWEQASCCLIWVSCC